MMERRGALNPGRQYRVRLQQVDGSEGLVRDSGPGKEVRLLCQAVLCQAVMELQSKSQTLRRQAEEYLFPTRGQEEREKDWPWAVRNVCEVLGVALTAFQREVKAQWGGESRVQKRVRRTLKLATKTKQYMPPMGRLPRGIL